MTTDFHQVPASTPGLASTADVAIGLDLALNLASEVDEQLQSIESKRLMFVLRALEEQFTGGRVAHWATAS